MPRLYRQVGSLFLPRCLSKYQPRIIDPSESNWQDAPTPGLPLFVEGSNPRRTTALQRETTAGPKSDGRSLCSFLCEPFYRSMKRLYRVRVFHGLMSVRTSHPIFSQSALLYAFLASTVCYAVFGSSNPSALLDVRNYRQGWRES